MTQMTNFTYSSAPNIQIDTPIWPDFSQGSEFSKLMIKAKTENDKDYWTHMRQVIKHDAETLPLERYKAWASIMSVPLMSNHKHSEYIRLCLDAAHKNPVYMDALVEPMVGMNEEDHAKFYSMFSDIKTTMNRVQLLGHLLMNGFTAEKLSGMKEIVEIGGGVGDLADIIYKLGFKGNYYLYDFEELHLVQKYLHDELGLQNVKYVTSYEELEKNDRIDLVIATWSLTEMPIDLRNKVIANIESKNWLVAYSKEIFGLDNQTWIDETFIPAMDSKDIELREIDFMSWDGGTKYIIATEK